MSKIVILRFENCNFESCSLLSHNFCYGVFKDFNLKKSIVPEMFLNVAYLLSNGRNNGECQFILV